MQRIVELDPRRSELRILFPYEPALVQVVKGLPGRRWNPDEKYWSVPRQHAAEVARVLVPRGFALAPELARMLDDGGAADALAGGLLDRLPERLPDGLPHELVGRPRERPADLFGDDASARAPGGAPEGQPRARETSTPPGVARGAESEGAVDDPPRSAPRALTVRELNELVRGVLRDAMPRPFWLQGEVVGYDRNAHKQHIYFQLAEKGEASERAEAEVTAVLFAGTRPHIERRLAQALDRFVLQDGIRIQVLVRVDLYPPKGSYQVIIEDLDPAYTLGELALRRERILAEIDRRGLRERNRGLPFPRPCLRLGLITSFGSDAYNDIVNELQRSSFAFDLSVRDCAVQGPQAEGAVLAALTAFAGRAAEFDALIIARGGGARTDLMAFDSLPLALAVAQHPLKVLIGIGHHRDRSVLDLLAHSEKTPTAVAQCLVALARAEDEHLRGAARELVERAQDELRRAGAQLATHALLAGRAPALAVERAGHWLRRAASRLQVGLFERQVRARRHLGLAQARAARAGLHALLRTEDRLQRRRERLRAAAQTALQRATVQLERARLRAAALDPRRILARGYAWLRNPTGASIQRVTDVQPGASFEVRLQDGSFRGRVESIDEKEPT